MNSKEAEAVRVFLSDLHHIKTVNRQFRQIQEHLSHEEMGLIVADLKARRIIDDDEERYLQRRLHIN